MIFRKRFLGIAGIAAALLFLAGCLVSGQFVTIIDIERAQFTTTNGFYYYAVDLTENDIWKEHKDNIKDIEVVGFELWMTNKKPDTTTFNVYVDDIGKTAYTSKTEVENNATLVIKNLKLKPSDQTHITYGQSFKYLQNVETLKTLVDEGSFHYYGVSNVVADTTNYIIDSARVIITFTAGL
jgi:hypothetical protein